MSRRLVIRLAAALTAAALLAPAAASAGPEPVVLQLRWRHQFQFAGYYAAQDRGYYADAGLAVEIREGGPGIDTVAEVAAGRAQYGVSNSEVLLQRLRGAPLVALAAVFQHSPLALLVRPDRGIDSPQQLRGRTVILSRESRDVEIQAMLRGEGVALEDLVIPRPFARPEDYADPAIDAFPAYLTNQPFLLEQRGIPFRVLKPSTYGIDFYGDCLFTSAAELADHPERVRAFREASLAGWRYALDHPEELVERIAGTVGSRKSREHLRFEAAAVERLILPELVEVGHMNPGRWRHIAETFAAVGMVPEQGNLEGFVYDPDRPADPTALRRGLAVAVAVSAGLALLAGGLLQFNRRLRREVRQREAAQRGLAESEARFRTLFDKSADPVLILEGERFVDCNEAAVDLLGCGDKSAILGAHPAELSPPTQPDGRDSFTKAREIMATARRLGSHRFEWVHRRADGGEVPVEVTLTAMPLGETTLLHTAWRDLTDKKRAEAERRELEARLHQAHKLEAVGTLAGGIAHDFNNILGAVLGYTELTLADTALDPKHRHNLGAVLTAAERARELVKQILTFSRRSEEQDRRPVALHQVVEEAMGLLRPAIPATIAVRVALDPDTGTVLADPTQLHQIVMNLGTNAYHAMRDTGGELAVTLGPAAVDARTAARYPDLREGRYALLTVADTGPGMTPEVLARVFDPFFTTKAPGEGTGMGLAVVQGIVRSHGGAVAVESRPGGGTAFRVYLPLAGAASDAPDAAHRGPARGRGERVLVVDDEPALADLEARLLESLGYRATAVTEPEAALAALEADPAGYHLLLTDQTMPGMTGDRLAREAMRRKPGLPVIICTGFSEILDEAGAQAIGVRALLMKPMGRDKLAETVRAVLDASG